MNHSASLTPVYPASLVPLLASPFRGPGIQRSRKVRLACTINDRQIGKYRGPGMRSMYPAHTFFHPDVLSMEGWTLGTRCIHKKREISLNARSLNNPHDIRKNIARPELLDISCIGAGPNTAETSNPFSRAARLPCVRFNVSRRDRRRRDRSGFANPYQDYSK